LKNKLDRAPKVTVWQIDPAQSQALAAMVARTLQWQVTIQDGTIWINDGKTTVEITPVCLKEAG
jgi:uncharacterized protein YaeQ